MPETEDLLRFIGWYDSATQTEPTYDPPHDGPCIVCMGALTPDDVRTVSVCAFVQDVGTRSLFYRMHRTCGNALSDRDGGDLDEAVLDAARKLPTEPTHA